MRVKQWNKQDFENQLLKLVTIIFSVVCFAFSITNVAMAYGPATEDNTLKPVGNALTPEGNLTLVDDIFTNNEGDKQFITAVSKNGNYFYLVIDRAGDDNNVYLLNLIDEADLVSLATGEPVPIVVEVEPVVAEIIPESETEEEPEPTPEPEPEPEPKTEETKKSSILPLICLLAICGAGAFYYFKIYKKQTNINPLLDGLEYDEEEDDDPFGIEKSEEKPKNDD